jgi:hypothetical protein
MQIARRRGMKKKAIVALVVGAAFLLCRVF